MCEAVGAEDAMNGTGCAARMTGEEECTDAAQMERMVLVIDCCDDAGE